MHIYAIIYTHVINTLIRTIGTDYMYYKIYACIKNSIRK